MHYWVMIGMVFVAGFLLPWQGGATARLAAGTPTGLHASFINFVIGAGALALCAAYARGPASLASVPSPIGPTAPPWWAWVGGLIGATYVAILVLAFPKIGAINFLVASVLGQLIGSAIMDHFGLMGLPKHDLSTYKILGLGVMVGGFVLMQLGSTR
jgi:bacterial/archaeal transporter family-2 protein